MRDRLLTLVVLGVLLAANALAGELDGGAPRRPQDWTRADREQAQRIFVEGAPLARALLIRKVADGTASNSFVSAVLPNLRAGRSGEYRTIEQRHVLYATLASLLRYAPGLPEASRGIRFFDAAATVTSADTAGVLEQWPAMLVLSETTGLFDRAAREALNGINARLLELNLALLRDVLYGDDRSRDTPTGAAASAWAIEFDRSMVVAEQEAVERYLVAHPLPAAARAAIDRLLATCAVSVVDPLLPAHRRLCQARRWGAEAGARTGTFFDQGGRVAIGEALVCMLHGIAETACVREIGDRLAALQPAFDAASRTRFEGVVATSITSDR